MTRRLLGGMLAALLLSGVAGAQTPTAPTEDAFFAALRRGAEQGDAAAQWSLGTAYEFGQGVSKDYGQAATWYRKAAEQGDAIGQYCLGNAYANGQGVPQDYVEAHKWRNLAASRTSAEQQKRYAGIRDAMATLMTPQQLAEAQQRASAWLAAFEKRGGK